MENENRNCDVEKLENENGNVRKKKFIDYALIILIVIFTSPMIVFVLLIYFFTFLVPAPIEYLLYNKSFYKKFFCEKYKIGITYDEKYKIYNLLRKKKINFVVHKYKQNDCNCTINCWQYLETEKCNLIFVWFEAIGFFTQNEKWEVEEMEEMENEDDHNLSMLDVSLNKYLKDNFLNSNKKIKIIIKENFFYNEEFSKKENLKFLQKAKEEELFFVYKNHKDFIKKLSDLK